MTPGEFVAAFDVIAEAPGGIERLRELVLQLAVRGRLVPQDADEEPPINILERNAKEKRHLVDQGKIIDLCKYKGMFYSLSCAYLKKPRIRLLS